MYMYNVHVIYVEYETFIINLCVLRCARSCNTYNVLLMCVLDASDRLRDDISIDSIPSTPLLDNSANKRKAILGTSGALATKRPPTRRASQSDVRLVSLSL